MTAAGTAGAAGADATVAVGAPLPLRLSPHGTASPGSPYPTNQLKTAELVLKSAPEKRQMKTQSTRSKNEDKPTKKM